MPVKDQNAQSMINQKTNEDFNKEKPDPKSRNFKEAITESPAAIKNYTCSIHPEIISSQPGKCPNCGMELVEKPFI